jgi:hypothetical protein
MKGAFHQIRKDEARSCKDGILPACYAAIHGGDAIPDPSRRDGLMIESVS